MTLQQEIRLPQVPRPRRRSFASLRAIAALMLREMSTSYGRSPGGYLWAVLEPVAGIALLSMVFSAAFHSPPLDISFPTFYATGMMPFLMFSQVQGKMATALLYSKPLLAYPSVTYMDALIARFILNAATEVLVSYIILAGCIMAFETRVVLDPVTVIEAFSLAALLALGVGTLNCYLFTRFPLWQRAWSVLMRPMFIISGVFMLYEGIPHPYDDWLWFNPLMHIVSLTHRGFYSNYEADFVSAEYVVGVSLVCLAVGLALLHRHHRTLLSET